MFMRNSPVTRGLLPLTLAVAFAGQVAADDAMPQTEEEKTLYALGVAVGANLPALNLTEAEMTFVLQGIAAAALGETPAVDMNVYGPKLQAMAQAKLDAAAQATKAEAAVFIAAKAAEPGAVQTDSGIVIREITAGDKTSAKPTATSKVTVHYHGTLPDGSVFDSSVDRGETVSFGLNQVIPCWTEAVQTMQIGDKVEIVCPSDVAYGDQGRPPSIPGGATLVFEIELFEISE